MASLKELWKHVKVLPKDDLRWKRIKPYNDKPLKEYVKKEMISGKYISDAFHIALASVNNITYIVSWNFEHIVKRKTRIIVKLINTLNGYKEIEIVSPQEL